MRMDLIGAGDFLSYFTITYTETLGQWAYFLILGIFVTMIYLKTQSFEMPFFIALIGAATLGFLMPIEIGTYLIFLLAIASAITMLRVFKS